MAASPTQESGDHSPRQDSPSAGQGLPADGLTIRSLVTTREAGIIIGKQGKNVAELREQTGVKAGVSKVVAGVHERVLSVTGTVEGVAKAYGIIVAQLLSSTGPGSPTMAVAPVPTHTSLRLLISHNLMGTIIGRNGAKIKAIQDASGARMIAAKEMLPQSTERIVEIQGTAEGISQAVEDIGRCLLEDWERGLGTVLYHPTPENEQRMTNTNRRTNFGGGGPHERRDRRPTDGADHPADGGERRRSVTSPTNGAASPSPTGNPANLRTQNISIPSDMVGCIIGKSGSKITEIRRLSGCKISIAKTPHDETGERMFTIVGTPEANEKALFLLYNQLESEKERRVGRGDAEEQ